MKWLQMAVLSSTELQPVASSLHRHSRIYASFELAQTYSVDLKHAYLLSETMQTDFENMKNEAVCML